MISRGFRSLYQIYIHCTVGASRAPTMAMAYFIQVRKIALLDIFKYLQAIRTVVQPNHHFLFQLAELEVSEHLLLACLLACCYYCSALLSIITSFSTWLVLMLL
jgi:predicted protein tyrosine phosphatase